MKYYYAETNLDLGICESSESPYIKSLSVVLTPSLFEASFTLPPDDEEGSTARYREEMYNCVVAKVSDDIVKKHMRYGETIDHCGRRMMSFKLSLLEEKERKDFIERTERLEGTNEILATKVAFLIRRLEDVNSFGFWKLLFRSFNPWREYL